MRYRLILASAISSTVLVGAIGVDLFLSAGVSLGWNKIPEGSLGHSLFFFFFFGWPLAMAGTLALCAVSRALLGEKGRFISFRAVLLSSAFLGAGGASLVWAIFWNDTKGIGQVGAIGFVAGLIAGTLLWAVWRPAGSQ
jgi:hypothetical protein